MSSERQILKRLLEGKVDYEESCNEDASILPDKEEKDTIIRGEHHPISTADRPNISEGCEDEDLDEKTYTVGDKQYWRRGGKCYCWTSSTGKTECSEDEYMKAISGGSDNSKSAPVSNTEPVKDKGKDAELPDNIKSMINKIKGYEGSVSKVTAKDIENFKPTENELSKLNKIYDKISSSKSPWSEIDKYTDQITKIVKNNIKSQEEQDNGSKKTDTKTSDTTELFDKIKELNFDDIPDYGVDIKAGDYSLSAFISSAAGYGDHMNLEVFDKDDNTIARWGDIQSQEELDDAKEKLISKINNHVSEKKYSTYTASPGTDEYHKEKVDNIGKFLSDNFDGKSMGVQGTLKVSKANDSAYVVKNEYGREVLKMYTSTDGEGGFRVERPSHRGPIIGTGKDPVSAYKDYKKTFKKTYAGE